MNLARLRELAYIVFHPREVFAELHQEKEAPARDIFRLDGHEPELSIFYDPHHPGVFRFTLWQHRGDVTYTMDTGGEWRRHLGIGACMGTTFSARLPDIFLPRTNPIWPHYDHEKVLMELPHVQVGSIAIGEPIDRYEYALKSSHRPREAE